MNRAPVNEMCLMYYNLVILISLIAHDVSIPEDMS